MRGVDWARCPQGDGPLLRQPCACFDRTDILIQHATTTDVDDGDIPIVPILQVDIHRAPTRLLLLGDSHPRSRDVVLGDGAPVRPGLAHEGIVLRAGCFPSAAQEREGAVIQVDLDVLRQTEPAV